MPSGSGSTFHKLLRRKTALTKPPSSKLLTDRSPEMASSCDGKNTRNLLLPSRWMIFFCSPKKVIDPLFFSLAANNV
jgi:hypothetical protein